MHVKGRLSGVAESVRERRMRTRAERLDAENHEMRTHLQALRGELDRERDARSEVLQTLQRLRPTTIEVKRRSGVLRLLLVGGAAYVVGARAGRERYEQIRAWWERTRSRAAETVGIEGGGASSAEATSMSA